MSNQQLVENAQRLISGEWTPEKFLHELAASTRTSDATLDTDRARRCGFAEVVFGEGKPVASLLEIVAKLLENAPRVLVTRVAEPQVAALQQRYPAQNQFNAAGRTICIRASDICEETDGVGQVYVISAGTSDMPVAHEAQETLDWMGVRSEIIPDVGVAGPQRLLNHVERIRLADALVVVAGMEGALPSVVGGHVACPVFAVPTSVGYGANLGGFAALLSMLNCCASNVAVVNIDAGFKAGYLAGLVATRMANPAGDHESRE